MLSVPGNIQGTCARMGAILEFSQALAGKRIIDQWMGPQVVLDIFRCFIQGLVFP